MLKKIGRHPYVQAVLAFIAERYLSLVEATTRFVMEPGDVTGILAANLPVISGFWHGQHALLHCAWPKGNKVSALVSRHGDAEINAQVLARLGILPIRGAGGKAWKMHQHGGVAATREMLRTMAGGTSIALTADVPKIARRCGIGIVTLAQLTGRPIFPGAVVTKWRIDFKSWDRASFPLPFGRGAMVLGEAVYVDRRATPEQLEVLRQGVEDQLNAVNARAYALLGETDPGRELNRKLQP